MIHSMALRLVAELRSGYHKQGKNFLHWFDGEKCCLGIACWMVHQNDRTKKATSQVYQYGYSQTHLSSLAMLRFGFHDNMGVRDDGKNIIIDGHSYCSLAAANDDGCTFAQIADYIEANWEAL